MLEIRALTGHYGRVQALHGITFGVVYATLVHLLSERVPEQMRQTAQTALGSTALGGPVRFVLGGSGHIAGIVNPPSAKKYHYWTNDARPDSPEDWFATATQHPGSWWADWQAWIDARNGGEKVPARMPGDGGLTPIEDGPGSYVMLRLGAKR